MLLISFLLAFALLFSISLQVPVPAPVIRPGGPALADVSTEFAWKTQGHHIRGTKCRSRNDGDVMAITYCYCGKPNYKDLNTSWPEAHYVEANYFNQHLNETYNLSETCKSNNRMDCLGHRWEFQDLDRLDSPMGRENREYNQDEWGKGYREIQWNGQCGYWSAEVENHNGFNVWNSPWDGHNTFYGQSIHKFCYWPNPNFIHEYPFDEGQSDRIYFDGQRRWLRDGQGYLDLVNNDVRQVCTKLCPEKTGMPILPWHETQVPSHQGCAFELDDMCKHCR